MNALVINCSPVRDGATAEIVKIVSDCLGERYSTECACIDDYDIHFCRGCRRCHTTAECVQHDGVDALMARFERADVIVCVSPSYWADVPGQFKAFIDRCTPWCNTHEPHATLSGGKRGYAIALRTGPGMPECQLLRPPGDRALRKPRPVFRGVQGGSGAPKGRDRPVLRTNLKNLFFSERRGGGTFWKN